MYCHDCDYPLKGLTNPRCPECGRGFDAGDTKSYLRRKRRGPLGTWAARLCLAALSANVALYFLVCWHFRTTTVGPEIYPSFRRAFEFWSIVGIYSVIAGGAFLIPLLWIGLWKRMYILGVATSLILPPVLAEGLAWYEEHLFVQRCQAHPPTSVQIKRRGPTIYARRWWPNQKHLLAYDQNTNELIDGN